MFKTCVLSAAAIVAIAASPASAQTIIEDALGVTGVNAYNFSFAGGTFQALAEAAGSNPLGDPYIYLFEQEYDSNGDIIGDLIAADDDSGEGLSSYMAFELGAGDYVLSIGRYSFSQSSARAIDAGGYAAGQTFRLTFGEGVDTGAVPEPATWAMMLGGFGLVGAAMRRRPTTSVAFARA